MSVCRNCGVQIEEGLARCPLCRAPTEGGPAEGGRLPLSAARPQPLTRRRFWEIVSLLAGTGGAVVLAADLANSKTVSWSRYPLVAILFLWAAASLLLFLRRRGFLLLLAGTGTLAAFLLALDLLMPGESWAPTLALPLTALAGAVTGLLSAMSRALRGSFFLMLAVMLAGAALAVLGLEAAIDLYLTGSLRPGWSLVVCGCVLPLVGLLLYVQYRLKATPEDIRRIFHM